MTGRPDADVETEASADVAPEASADVHRARLIVVAGAAFCLAATAAAYLGALSFDQFQVGFGLALAVLGYPYVRYARAVGAYEGALPAFLVTPSPAWSALEGLFFVGSGVAFVLLGLGLL